MLQAIREKAQGWIAWAIVVLISIPFALWGIQEYLGVGGEPEVAVVDGDKITQRMLDERTRDFRENLRQQLGDDYAAGLLDAKKIKSSVLDAMVEEMVLTNNAAAWNLRTSDAQARAFIGSVPVFQRDGRFDQDLYDATVRNQGMSRAGFEARIRQDMALGQLRSGVRDTAFVTDADMQAFVRLRNEKRSVSFARIPAADFAGSVEVKEAELRAFYDANIDRYRTPERVKLEYLLLDAERLSALVKVSDEALRQYYADHKAEFVAPEERAMRHILIAVPPGADDAAVETARQEALGLLGQLRGGADFAALAREKSADPGSAQNGGDLGWVERGVMVPEFEEAAFAAAPGVVTEPVRTEFGFHLVEVTDIRGGSKAGFDDVREKVDRAYRKFEAESLYFDYAERLAQTAYEDSASLAPAAEALGLEIQTSDWLTRSGGLQEPLSSPKVRDAAFSDDVLNDGHNSELMELGPQQAAVVRVVEHEPEGVKSFDDNKTAIERDFRREREIQAAAAEGDRLLAQLRSGDVVLADAAAAKGWSVEQAGSIGRRDTKVPGEVLSAAFSLSPPAGGKSAFVGAASPDGDYFLIEIAAVEGGRMDAVSDVEKPMLGQQMMSQAGNAQMSYVTRDLRGRADIEIKPIEE
ncbi:MAG: SurA N-terminal domain-containing protein [Chromatiaceae bacterium]|nr:SurA N-terminal domain-containing protein [Gammaproteobacteria bacterium]MCP5312337.1 SurA N-terminal domain-containing protein [Chromatiaceae bacterium]